jgi:uncharacterized protein (TIGR02271 family)
MNEASYSGGETITAFFDQRSEAEAAVTRLRSAGISDSSIRLSGNGTAAGTGSSPGSSEEKGFLESLSDFFFPEEDRHAYEEGMRRGGYLVCVTGVANTERERLFDVLEDAGAVDFNEREQSWRSEGWTGSTGAGAGYGSGGTHGAGYGSGAGSASAQAGFAEERGTFSGRAGSGTDEEAVPVVEEELRVGKRDRSHGRVRVRSYVSERPVSEEVTLRDERVDVERRPVDRPLHAGEDAFRERSIEAEEHSEEAVVDKQARVVEEVALRKQSDTHTDTVSDTVRRTDVEVDREDDETTSRR